MNKYLVALVNFFEYKNEFFRIEGKNDFEALRNFAESLELCVEDCVSIDDIQEAFLNCDMSVTKPYLL